MDQETNTGNKQVKLSGQDSAVAVLVDSFKYFGTALGSNVFQITYSLNCQHSTWL
jgi:hypothetical protein